MGKITAKYGHTFYKDGVAIGMEIWLGCNDSEINYEQRPDDEQGGIPATDYGRLLSLRTSVTRARAEINTFALTDAEALSVKEFYPGWEEGIDVAEGERYNCDGDLWEVLATHKTQASWRPSLATASIWKHVDEEHEGTERDPIPYSPPMEVVGGKYYTQDGKTYLCVRDSGMPLSHDLSAVVGIYVDVV